MDENTIFQPPAGTQNPSISSVQGSQPSAPVSPTPEQPQTTPPIIPPTGPGGISEEGSLFSLGNIIKVIIALVVLIVLGFGIFRFVIPLFTKPSNEQAKILYWGLWEDKKVMESIISDFKRENPKIAVEYVKQDVKQYRQRLVTRSENGTGPDVFRFHNTWVTQLSSLLLPLPQDVMSPSEFKKTYYPVVQKDLIKGGAIYGIPLGIDTLSLFVNTEILESSGEKVPQTWDEFIKTARALTVKDEEGGRIVTAGAAMGTFDNVQFAPDIISVLLAQNGANLENLKKTPKASSDALNFYVSFAKGQGNVWDSTLDPSLLAFTKGNLAMYFGYSWNVFAIKAGNPNLKFSIHPVPHVPEREITVASYWVEGVFSKSKNKNAAFKFLKFLAKKETQQKLFTETAKTRLFGEPYSRVDLGNSLKNNDLVYPFVQQAPKATSSYFASETYDEGINSKLNVYLGNAVRSMFDNTSADSAVETLSEGIDQVLRGKSAE